MNYYAIFVLNDLMYIKLFVINKAVKRLIAILHNLE